MKHKKPRMFTLNYSMTLFGVLHIIVFSYTSPPNPNPQLFKVKVTQLCLIPCDPMDYTVHGILQARILEWVPFSSPGDLPNPGIEPRYPALQAGSLPAEPKGKLFKGKLFKTI